MNINPYKVNYLILKITKRAVGEPNFHLGSVKKQSWKKNESVRDQVYACLGSDLDAFLAAVWFSLKVYFNPSTK